MNAQFGLIPQKGKIAQVDIGLHFMGMVILEMEDILEQTNGEDRRDSGDEGPLGPLPDGILE